MTFDNFEIDGILNRMVVLIDTREQDTSAFRRRVRDIGCPVERIKLDYGDYTCRTTLPDGREYSLANKLVVERKMNLDELCACFGKGRARFTKEFDRAKADGATVILLVENDGWAEAFAGEYRSLYRPAALTASIFTWMERYGMIPQFIPSHRSGEFIYKLLRYSLKERLERGIPDEA